MNLIFLFSVVLKGLGAVLEILLQILITAKLQVEGYGTYSAWINSADLIFWVCFSGLVKCNTFYLSGGETTIRRFKTKYFLRYALPVLGVAAVLYPNSKIAGLDHVNYQPLFWTVSGIMVAAVVTLLLTIREPKLAAENAAYEAAHPEEILTTDDGSGKQVLPKAVKKSLGFLLASICLWFIGYNGVTTWFTVYVGEVMGQGLGGASTCLMVATGGAIVSYIPIGQLAGKIGRKRTIQLGICLLTACFASGYFLTTAFDHINLIMFVVFALVGLAWAAINVNSLPMVVEMCKGSDIGKFTGYYYTFSMSAQVITPIVAGTLLRNVGYWTLFPYAAAFVALSFVTMLFVKHGDSKLITKKGLESFDVDD